MLVLLMLLVLVLLELLELLLVQSRFWRNGCKLLLMLLLMILLLWRPLKRLALIASLPLLRRFTLCVLLC